MKLRSETEADFQAIRDVTLAAFAIVPYGDGTEGEIIDRLRSDGDLSLSYVAEVDGEVVGHVALSPAMIGDETGWYGMGPISVLPSAMGKGIGGALVNTAIDWAKAQGARGIVLAGSDTYYPRFGFSNENPVTYLDLYKIYVHTLTLSGPEPKGAITFAPALHGA